MACDIVSQVKESALNVRVGTLVCDDDASTIKSVREEVDENIEKWSDISHVKRLMGNQLYNMKNKYKGLSEKVINHVKKCFAFARQQSKGAPSQLADAVRAITHNPSFVRRAQPIW